MCILIVNFNVFFKLIKVYLLVSELCLLKDTHLIFVLIKIVYLLGLINGARGCVIVFIYLR